MRVKMYRRHKNHNVVITKLKYKTIIELNTHLKDKEFIELYDYLQAEYGAITLIHQLKEYK